MAHGVHSELKECRLSRKLSLVVAERKIPIMLNRQAISHCRSVLSRQTFVNPDIANEAVTPL